MDFKEEQGMKEQNGWGLGIIRVFRYPESVRMEEGSPTLNLFQWQGMRQP